MTFGDDFWCHLEVVGRVRGPERVAATRWHPGEKCFAIGGSAAHANML